MNDPDRAKDYCLDDRGGLPNVIASPSTVTSTSVRTSSKKLSFGARTRGCERPESSRSRTDPGRHRPVVEDRRGGHHQAYLNNPGNMRMNESGKY